MLKSRPIACNAIKQKKREKNSNIKIILPKGFTARAWVIEGIPREPEVPLCRGNWGWGGGGGTQGGTVCKHVTLWGQGPGLRSGEGNITCEIGQLGHLTLLSTHIISQSVQNKAASQLNEKKAIMIFH